MNKFKKTLIFKIPMIFFKDLCKFFIIKLCGILEILNFYISIGKKLAPVDFKKITIHFISRLEVL